MDGGAARAGDHRFGQRVAACAMTHLSQPRSEQPRAARTLLGVSRAAKIRTLAVSLYSRPRFRADRPMAWMRSIIAELFEERRKRRAARA
jgi:hypothetical protein